VSGISHREKLFPVNSTFASPIHTLGFRPIDAFALTLLDEPSLQLRDHAEDGHDNSTGFAARRYVGIKYGHERFSLVALVNDVENVSGIAAESIKARHDQFVTRPQKLNDGRQFSSAGATSAGDLFRANDAAAFRFQASELGIEVLINGADAGVPNSSHGLSPQGVKPDPTASQIVAVNPDVTCLLIGDVTSREGIP
jgi:hypothetical protein